MDFNAHFMTVFFLLQKLQHSVSLLCFILEDKNIYQQTYRKLGVNLILGFSRQNGQNNKTFGKALEKCVSSDKNMLRM